jgi:hypothetical protein
MLLCTLLLAVGAPAQVKMERPDYDAIKKATADKGSPMHFAKLQKRLVEKDTTMTDTEFRNLYYGYIFQDAYDPYGINDDFEKIKTYFQKEELTEKDRQKFIELAEKSLKNNLFDLRTMNFLAYVYHLEGNDAMAMKTSFMLHHLLGAIFSTGDGLTCETGFHVTSVGHEYVILNMLELQSTGQSLVGNCDFISLEKGKYKVDGLYFDISKMQEASMELFGK